MRKHKIATIRGAAQLTGPAKDGIHHAGYFEPRRVGGTAETSQLKAKNIILATGSEAKTAARPRSPTTAFSPTSRFSPSPQAPKSLIVIGAGAVGVEFGSIFRSFGSEVTILEFLPRLVPRRRRRDFQGTHARLQEARHRRQHRRARREGREDRNRREGDLHRRERQTADEGGREGAGRRGPLAAH